MSFVTFTKVGLPYGWLGNMAPYSIQLDGVVWRTTEALFQALRFDDLDVREAIRAERSPMGAKFVAKRFAAKMVVTPTTPEDVENMRRVLALKVTQHPALIGELKATGDAVIIEDVSARASGRNLFWGGANRGAMIDGPWEGENWLGRLWMELRAARCSSRTHIIP